MISRAHRFHGYNSLDHVYRHGTISRGPSFAIKAMPNPRRKSYRAAVVVSRKVNKSAVARNRMRRRLYESIRELEPQISAPFDIVITVFQDSLQELPPEKLKSQLTSQLRDTGVIKSV
jgi:ribonuclease P protein component